MKRLKITCDDKLILVVRIDLETWIITNMVQLSEGDVPNFVGHHYSDLALWLQKSKFLKIVHECICDNCCGEGVAETELYEGLVNCPSCRPDRGNDKAHAEERIRE